MGYRQAVGHLDAYDMKPETASTETKGGKTPDARLGFYDANGKEITRAAKAVGSARLCGPQTRRGFP